MAEVEIQSDDEQEQDQADFAEHGEGLPQRGVEDRARELWAEVAEARRAENQAGGDLAHDGRLAEAAEDGREEPRGRYDHDDLDQGPEEQLLGLVRSEGFGGDGRGCGQQVCIGASMLYAGIYKDKR